jgi:hypothetical protein
VAFSRAIPEGEKISNPAAASPIPDQQDVYCEIRVIMPEIKPKSD